MRSAPYDCPFPRWPFVKFDFEKVSRRWFAPRGISAMLRDLQRETNAQHNGRLDAMALRNAPVYQVPAVAGFKARNFRVAPGEVLQLPVGARLEPLIQDRGAFPESVNEENNLRTIAEQYIGTFDAALTDRNRSSRARTATEIQAVQQQLSATSSLDAIHWQLQMRELHTMIWQIFLALGPPEVFTKVLGEDPNQVEPVGINIKKSDIDRKFKLIPTGTIANTNRALELANAREALQLYGADQTGLINLRELYRWHLNLLTYRWARRIINPESQANNTQVINQAAEAVSEDPSLLQ
jgi:hypothetical protein